MTIEQFNKVKQVASGANIKVERITTDTNRYSAAINGRSYPNESRALAKLGSMILKKYR